MTTAVGGAETTEKTRIFVGGLGVGVTEEDLRKTFSALGEVVAVDVVRTKGRSFAYLDFLPSSDKSLPKLFSTYNGCMWKGGKLRLEKAKEHYLLRLRREWLEEAKQASEACSHDADPSENRDSLEKPKKPSSLDKMKLNIFFPKLRKVKSLASVGIGKHKYSFQRIQVPSIPSHFCDCEEHSRPFLTEKRKCTSATEDGKNLSEFENESAGISEQELNIMNSVMNKLFEREKQSNRTVEESELVNGRGDSNNSNDELLATENDEEDHLTDEDNLIINVVSKENDSTNLLSEMKTLVMNKEPAAKKLRASGDRKPKNARDNQKRKTLSLSKNRKSSQSEMNDGTDTVITEKTVRTPEIHLNIQGDSRAEIESGTKQLESNALRSKKSSWKDLISQKGNTFSITDIISELPQVKKDEPNGDDQEKMILHRNKKRKSYTSSTKTESSIPETATTSQMPMNIQENTTTELESVAQEFSAPGILPNVSRQNEKETGTDDLDVPLPKISQAFCISDILPSIPQQNEKEPMTNNLDVPLTKNVENDDFNQHGNADRQTEDSMDLEKPNEALPGKQDDNSVRVARGAAWRHTSSWTQLLSSRNDTSFSISKVLPNLSLQKHEQQVENDNLNPAPANVMVDAQALPGKDQEEIEKGGGVSSPSVVKRKTSERRRILSLGDVDTNETCPFMRTEASMKEWRKLKAGGRGSYKKKKSVEESA